MMAILNHLLIGILILQIYVNAAPSDVGKLEDIAKVEKAEVSFESTPIQVEKADESTESTLIQVEKADESTESILIQVDKADKSAESTPIEIEKDDESSKTTPIEAEDNENPAETIRQKRFYNPYGFGFPPINPNFNRGYDFSNPGNFGVEDPLVEIQRRVQEIANFARQPPPGIPHVPVFYPVLFVPPFDCQCNPTDSQPTEAPTTNGPPTEDVTIESRWPNIDDRQNWGVFVNNTNSIEDRNENQGVQDFRRPISFDPIRVNRPTSRPAPPVEHGSLEGDAAANQRPQAGGNRPSPPSQPGNRPPSPPPTATRPPLPAPSTGRPFPSSPSGPGPQNSPFNPNRVDPRPPQNVPPSTCDGAILTCCHRPQVVYECFAIQGCPNFTSYGNPCNPNTILRIIKNFERFYGSVNNGY